MFKYARPESPVTLAQRYEDKAQIQRALVRDLLRLCEIIDRLVSAFRLLFADEHFTTLLRAEGLDCAPTGLLKQVRKKTRRGQRPPDATEWLREKKLSPKALHEFERMAPGRREEVAWLMIASGCFEAPYVITLVGACDYSMLINSIGRPRKLVMKQPQRKAANREISQLANQLRGLSGFGGQDLITLFVSIRYTQRLLDNRPVWKYLRKRWPGVGEDLQKTVRKYRGAEPILMGNDLSINQPSIKFSASGVVSRDRPQLLRSQ